MEWNLEDIEWKLIILFTQRPRLWLWEFSSTTRGDRREREREGDQVADKILKWRPLFVKIIEIANVGQVEFFFFFFKSTRVKKIGPTMPEWFLVTRSETLLSLFQEDATRKFLNQHFSIPRYDRVYRKKFYTTTYDDDDDDDDSFGKVAKGQSFPFSLS